MVSNEAIREIGEVARQQARLAEQEEFDNSHIEIILNKRTAKEHLNALRLARCEGEEYESTNDTIKFLQKFLED